MMRLAATRFSVGPEGFWRLSVREWRALAAPEAGRAMTRAELERLIERCGMGRRHPGRSEAESRDLNAAGAELGSRIGAERRPG